MTEEYKEENVDNKRKRVRDELEEDNSESNSVESKLARVDSSNSDGNSVEPNLGLFESFDSGMNSPEAKRIQDDLLNILDESDPDPAIQGLDSVIKSFEEEILFSGQVPTVMTLDSGETGPELGYLLEASDDDLGLPPSFSSGDDEKIEEAVDLKTTGSCPPVALGDIGLEFDDGILSFEPYKFGIGGDPENNNFSNDFITLGGDLFDSYEPSDLSEYTWRIESLSAS